jgi:hypothetical protein
VLDTAGSLVSEVDKKTRKPWITQEIINKMGQRRKRKKINNEEGRKNYRRLRNELKRATDKAQKEYLESMCDDIMEFHEQGFMI